MSKASESTLREREGHLVELARSGDRTAVRTLVDLHKDRLYAFIWRMVRNHHEAEDICQDAFLKAFASLDSFSSAYRFSTWLFTIGYRVCLNRLRKRRKTRGEVELHAVPLPPAEPVPDSVGSEDAARLRDAIWSTVDRLSPPQRASVVLFYRHGMSCQEIARVVELPLATVKSHLHRARARLREMLEPLADQDWENLRNLSSRAV